MDFYVVKTKRTKEGTLVYPDFIVKNSKDLLVKGRAFYAIWDEERGLYSRDEMDVARKIDKELWEKANEIDAIPLLMASYESKSWTQYKQYVSSLDDSEVDLDVTLTFADDVPDRKKHASRRLPYSLVDGPCPAWDELVGTLYSPTEREKIEWLIGSIISGDSKRNQKFFVFYGQSGHGKSTIIGILEKLFEGYYIPIDMKALGSQSSSFAMAGFKQNPLLAIQHDGDLSRIEDNTKLNSLVSHELMPINEKFKAEYYSRIHALLVLGTNEPVKITGSKSGIIRRLVDIHPSGDLIENRHYHILLSQVDFELGQIAHHCLAVYQNLGKHYYSNYKPTLMMYETDIFYNFVEHSYDLFYTQDGITLSQAWQLYKEFCEDALIKHRLQLHQFRAELQNYFEKFEDRAEVDGVRVRSYYSSFKTHRFLKVDTSKPIALNLDETTSRFDSLMADQPAQYANDDGWPRKYWTDGEQMIKGQLQKPRPSQVVDTTLADLDTSQLHFVKVPEHHIVIDFDRQNANGEKSLELNLEAAAEWPPTYAELSQSGKGVHLHYYYAGPSPVQDIRNSYSEGIEIKTLLGNASLRRRLTRCNNLGIATLTSGLPTKEKTMHDAKAMSSEKSIRRLIVSNLKKEHHPGTKPSIDFIKHILDEAYLSKIPYDVSDLHPDVYSFAMDSTNHARYCMGVVRDMKFMSESLEFESTADEDGVVIYDVEVFPNLFVVCWKYAGKDDVVRMINPSAHEIEELIRKKLVGFNCRRYDNHILYAASMGYSVEQLHELSQRIINNDRSALFGSAYDISYADIYDYSSVKQSLKKFEIDLGIHHMELSLPWGEPVDPSNWDHVVEYCVNDVLATEAVHNAREADFTARKILAELSSLPINASTQQHTARILFGKDRSPQSKFIYTKLDTLFPGYTFDFGKSVYRDEEVGEGGYVYAEPGYYKNVCLLDVASMHPTSIELLELFGDYTEKFVELKEARLAIKHGDISRARRMMDGKLAPYLEDETQIEALAYALKIVINIVYGLTSARFENPFRDPRNVDNIVAKRGALFMIDLKHFVQEELGLQVVHIKTDSIKVPDATEEQIQAIMEFGSKYGYTFEHEATYSEFALFNDAVYIARTSDGSWHATGAQFQHPYVFKKLLSHEEINFEDLCETKNVVKGAIYLEKDEDGRRFIGRIGRFIPLLPGTGGGRLLRVVKTEATNDKPSEEKAYAVTGTKDYEWLEADIVKSLGLEQHIDYTYFEKLVARAVEDCNRLGLVLN